MTREECNEHILEDGVGVASGGAFGGFAEERMGNERLMSLMMSKITGIQAEMTKKESMIHTTGQSGSS